MNKYTLIVPMLNASKKYEKTTPIEFQYDNETGRMNCIKSIEGINLSSFKEIYFVIFKHHELMYNISDKILLHQKNNHELSHIRMTFSFVDYPTRSEAQTVYDEIKKRNIKGPIFIKDTDNMCLSDKELSGNIVLVYKLENTPIVDPQHKSYIAVDDQNFVTNIIEKRVISNYFNCGGYGFNDAQNFIDAYEALLMYEDLVSHMYISHIIYWLILNRKLKFRPVETVGYKDFEIKIKL